MTDYINKDDVLDIAMTAWSPMDIREEEPDVAWVRGFNAALNSVYHLPAADVRPVVRGTWVNAKGAYFTPGGGPVWECSECGKGCHVYGIEHTSYGGDVADGQWVSCPNCGADMREGER